MVRAEGLEPPRVSPRDPKSRASAGSATPACAFDAGSSHCSGRRNARPTDRCRVSSPQRMGRHLLWPPSRGGLRADYTKGAWMKKIIAATALIAALFFGSMQLADARPGNGNGGGQPTASVSPHPTSRGANPPGRHCRRHNRHKPRGQLPGQAETDALADTFTHAGRPVGALRLRPSRSRTTGKGWGSRRDQAPRA